MSDTPQLAPGLSFFQHKVGVTRYVYSALPMLTLYGPGEKDELADSLRIDPGLNHEIFADGLTIRGQLVFEPGTKVTIVARSLATIPAIVEGKPLAASIDVSGRPGPQTFVDPQAQPGETMPKAADAVRGGNFSNGSKAQAGQGGGHGSDGKDGADGSHAGEIRIFVHQMSPSANLSLLARGGNGGDGQKGGNGGNGGDGGHGVDFTTAGGRHMSHWYYPSAEGGTGGDAGAAGRGGAGGNGGLIECRHGEPVVAGESPTQTPTIEHSNGPGAGGATPGPAKAGTGGLRPAFMSRRGHHMPPEHERTELRAKDGDIRTKPAGPARPEPAPGAWNDSTLTFDELAGAVDPSHCMMLLQRVKAGYATATVDTYVQGHGKPKPSGPVPAWLGLLMWLSDILEAIERNPKLQTKHVLNRPAFRDLLYVVRLLRQRAEKNQDMYGKYIDQVETSMLSYSVYQKSLEEKLKHLDTVAGNYTALFSQLKAAKDVDARLQDGMRYAKARSTLLKEARGKLVDTLFGQLHPQLEQAGLAIATARSKVVMAGANFKGEINAVQFSLDDFLSALTMIAFSPPGLTDLVVSADGRKEGGEVHGLPMTIIQGVDVINKAVSEVKTDQGTPVQKNYLIRRITSMEKSFSGKDFLRAWEDNKGLLKDPETADSHKILVKIEDYERLVEDYLRMDTAQKLEAALEGLKSAIVQRNEILLNYNAHVEQILWVQEQIKTLESESTTALATLAKTDNPELPRVVAFLSLQYADALDEATRELHMANKAFAYWSLDTQFNPFRQVLLNHKIQWRAQDAVGSVTPLMLGLCRDAMQSKFAEAMHRPPEAHIPDSLDTDSHQIFITDANLLSQLQSGKQVSIRITPDAARGAFTDPLWKDFHNIRLLGMLVFLHGAELKDPSPEAILKLEVTHGIEDLFMNRIRAPVTFRHETLSRFNFEYRPRHARYQGDRLNKSFIVNKIIFGGGTLTAEALRDNREPVYAGYGPFTTWTIAISPETPITAEPVTKIEIQFLFTYQKV